MVKRFMKVLKVISNLDALYDVLIKNTESIYYLSMNIEVLKETLKKNDIKIEDYNKNQLFN